MKDLEKIFRYLDGEMTGKEKHQFVETLEKNKSLNQIKLLTEEIDAVIVDEQTLEFIEKLKETQELYNTIMASNYFIGEDTEIVTTRTKRVYWRQIGAAVITFFLIISTIFFNFSRPSHKKIFSSYYEPYKVTNTFNRATKSSNVNKLIDAAVASYDKGNYQNTIALCQQIIRTNKENVPAHFFSGISYIELNNFNKAIDNLISVMDKNDIFYSQQAEWFLALCFLETNQIKRSTSLLINITKKNKYYNQKAADLLRALK